MITENIFTVFWAVEMILKIRTYGWAYFWDAWNITDFLLAWLSILGAWVILYTLIPTYCSCHFLPNWLP